MPASALPMFPLGSVLMPGMVLPLHIFEERYRALIRRCLGSDPFFGVPLIAQGSEVGGGESRTSVATAARIVDAIELPDGRWQVLAVGVERIRVVEWLADDPHPMAMVETWPDDATDELSQELVDRTTAALDEACRLATSLGIPPAPPGVDPGDDPSARSFSLCLRSPLGPVDRYDLLCAPHPTARLELLHTRLLDQIVLFGAELAMRPGSGVSD